MFPVFLLGLAAFLACGLTGARALMALVVFPQYGCGGF
jgi:hypothetical protein